MKVIETVLPFLIYKNDNIYFIPKNPIKISISKDIKYINEIKLSHIQFNNSLYCNGHNISYEILKEEYENCVKVLLNIDNVNYISLKDIETIDRNIVAHILNYDIESITQNEKTDIDEDDFYLVDKKHIKKNKYDFKFNNVPINTYKNTFLNYSRNVRNALNVKDESNNNESFICIERD